MCLEKDIAIQMLERKLLAIMPEIGKIDEIFSGYQYVLSNEYWKDNYFELSKVAEDEKYQRKDGSVRIGVTLSEMHFLSVAP